MKRSAQLLLKFILRENDILLLRCFSSRSQSGVPLDSGNMLKFGSSISGEFTRTVKNL